MKPERCCGHVEIKECDYFDAEVGTGSQEAYKKQKEESYTYCEREVTESVGARDEDTEDAIRWRQMIRCDDPRRKQRKGEAVLAQKLWAVSE